MGKEKALRRSIAYNEAIQRIYDLQTFGMKLGLTNIRRLLSRLGNPQENFSVILVAGTNGKGVVSASLASILRESGYKVGLFTSPHLVRFTERIRVDGHEIPQKDLVKESDRIWRELELMQSGDSSSTVPVTFFEFSTALACQHFAGTGVEVAVFEVGMGGRLDATNALDPVLSVITSVDFDHEKHLGRTLEEIAREKAGIFREGVPGVALDGPPEVLDSLRRVAGRVGAPLTIVDDQAQLHRDGRTFDLSWYGTGLWGLRTPLPGRHQVQNSSLAAVAGLELRDLGFRISSEAIRRGLLRTRWPGRFELLGRNPQVIMDGAHNPAAITALVDTMRSEGCEEPVIPVVTMLQDKDVNGSMRVLSELGDTIVVTSVNSDRGMDAEELRDIAREHFAHVHAVPDPVQALALGRRLAGRSGTVIVTGSIYLVGHIREAILGPEAP